MQVVGVIPARYASTRFPGKPMARLLQKPMIEWVYRGAQQSQSLSRIIVATDHPEIKSCVESFGGEVVMTKSDLCSGSDRVWAAIQTIEADVVVNIQGDEPLLEGDVLDRLIEPLKRNEYLEMSTVATSFKSMEDFNSKNCVKVILNKDNKAIYFSRYPIPHSRSEVSLNELQALKHIGLYAYKKTFLQKFCEQQPVAIELSESLEQLRAMFLGAQIEVVKIEHDSIGVDVPSDIEKVEKILKQRESKTHG